MLTGDENLPSSRITLRPVIHPDDDHFLEELYISTRDDLAGLSTDETQRLTLLTMQYTAQNTSYARQFPEASHDIILLNGEAIGRLMVQRRSNVVCLVDIALLPGVRNQGTGTALLKLLMEECSQRTVPIELSVLKTNIALRLYERLGFQIINDNGTHYLMRFEQP